MHQKLVWQHDRAGSGKWYFPDSFHALCLAIHYQQCIALHLHLFIAQSQKKWKLACSMQSQGLRPSRITSWNYSQNVPQLPLPSQCV